MPPSVFERVESLLHEHGIAFQVLLHEPVYNIDEAARVRLAVQRVEWATFLIPGKDSPHG